MLSRPYFGRVPDQSLVAGTSGPRYDHQAATRGETYAFVYTWNGKDINVNLGKIKGNRIKASWYDPRTGETSGIGEFDNRDTRLFETPGEPENGNDWVLILDGIDN